uniref:CWH43-like N-terminal domain-containing protein n=1 Tax=Stomoxys calcitrans TaxID=35570 RepID=A0A1I8Q8Q1_STOCA
MSDSRVSGKRLTSSPSAKSDTGNRASSTNLKDASKTKSVSQQDTEKEATVDTKQIAVNEPFIETTPCTFSTDTSNDLPFAVHYFTSFHRICVVTALLPLVTLFTCFVTAYVFQYDDVHETHCRVYNIVPSISAITGVSPQRYFWRFSIALHLGPRLPIAFIYKNYYNSMLAKLKKQRPEKVGNMETVVTIITILNCIEIASLGGVTYISNRENYPMHEKIFITFMICSLCHMLATIKLNGVIHEDHTELSQKQRDSIKWKKILFAMSILSTIGLLIFFAKHRFYCHVLAFSWFAFFEYLIAIANMFFHFTIIWDFSSLNMLIVDAPRAKLEELFRKSALKMD